VHVHGILFFAWTILLISQAQLAQASVQTHRAVGLGGISLATAMIFTSVAVIVRSLVVAIDAGTEMSARALAIVPVFAISTFAICFALAVVNIRRPDYHKRFVVLATVALLPAAFARILFMLFAPENAARPEISAPVPDINLALNLVLIPALLADALLGVAVIHDWRTRGRPHAVYVIGGLCLVGTQILRPLIARTDAWHSLTDALLGLAR